MPPDKKKNVPPRIEILSIGNELLIGHTLDTNSHWIAKQLLQLGWKLERVTKLRDSLDEISSGIQESLERRPKVLITLGGLGPTHDDMTLKGVGRALGRPLKVNPGALAMIRGRYAKVEGKAGLTVHRRKMANLPQGAIPLPNPIGTAPAVLTDTAHTTIFSLPGVPSEMKAIFNRLITPYLAHAGGNPPSESELRIVGLFESTLAPVLDKARREFPGIYFKSHPKGRETRGSPVIILHVYNTDIGSGGQVPLAAAYILDKLSRIK